MTANRAAELWKIVRPPDAPDAVLLARFAAGRDAEAFRELVRRHGPLVLGVCRRVAGHAQDAEDAFQAVFLILAYKAAVVRRPEVLGNWIYGVAVRVARRAKRSAARRRKREVQVRIMPDPPGPESDARADLAPALDAELAALPAWYRDAVLLCDLQGLSRAEVAERLGIPEARYPAGSPRCGRSWRTDWRSGGSRSRLPRLPRQYLRAGLRRSQLI
jgi:RNA polymerase sigma factor (sigma-70 family)